MNLQVRWYHLHFVIKETGSEEFFAQDQQEVESQVQT